MRRRALSLACMLALLPLAGCMDALLDDGQEPDESVDANGSNESNGTTDNGSEVILGPEPIAPPFEAPPVTTTPEPTPTTPLTPIEQPTPPASTPPPAQPTPPPAQPTPPPAETPPAPTPPPATQPTAPSPAPTPPSPTPTTPSPQPQAWPREGSYVKYAWRIGQFFAGSEQGWEHFGNVTWTYANGDWRGVCVMEAYDREHDGSWNNHTIRHEFTASSPPHWPPMNTRSPPAVGGEVTTWYLRDCELSSQTLYYAGTSTEATTVNGQPATVQTHLAEDNYPPEQPMSWRSEWSPSTGLVVAWSYARGGSAAHSNSGRIVDTDAPL